MIINIMPLAQNKPFFWKDRRYIFKSTKAMCFLKIPYFACVSFSLSSYPYICKHSLFLSSPSRKVKWPIGKMPIYEASWHKNLSPHSSSKYILKKLLQKNKSISTIHLLLPCPCDHEKKCLYLENRINTEAIFTSLVLPPPQILFVVSAFIQENGAT